MTRLTFLVNRGENDCFMIHGLDWATYVEGDDWIALTQGILNDVEKVFGEEDKPDYLDFKFADGTIVSLCA